MERLGYKVVKGKLKDLINKIKSSLVNDKDSGYKKRNTIFKTIVVLGIIIALPIIVTAIITYTKIPDITINNEKMGYKYHYLHQMANTVIFAEDGERWGNKKITSKRIEKMIEEFSGKDEIVVSYLELWKKGDFYQSVEFHNYIWVMLQGTVGKASNVNNLEVKRVLSRMQK